MGINLSKTIPKRIFSLVDVKPGEKLYEVCVILTDVPGALAKATKVMANANVNIKTGSVFYLPDRNELGSWTSFIDVSKATKSIGEIVEDLRKLDVVEEVKFEEPKPAPFETLHFPLLHGKTRAVIMPIGTIWAVWDGLEKILLPSGFAAVNYNAGKKSGEHTATRLKEMYGLESTDLILALIQALKATGWGIGEARDIDFRGLSGTIIVKECFEAVAWRKKPYNVCHWTRGYIAGAVSVVFGKPVEAVEVRCLAKGDEHCEFKIQPKI